MDSVLLLNLTTFAYMTTALLYVALLIYGSAIRPLGLAATGFCIGSLILASAGILARWLEAYRLDFGFYAPFSNMYESLIFFAWCVTLGYLVVEYSWKTRSIGAFAMPIAFIIHAIAEYWPQWNQDLRPLIPALQSNWLVAHVIGSFIGYAAFAIGFGLAVMYLLKSADIKQSGKLNGSGVFARMPSLKLLDDLLYKTLLFGFVAFSVGALIFGSVWANSAWGSYWSWDPKETWSLITWFIYAATLHIRYSAIGSSKQVAWLAILGFAATLFTYYGVNYWLSGLHSYS